MEKEKIHYYFQIPDDHQFEIRDHRLSTNKISK